MKRTLLLPAFLTIAAFLFTSFVLFPQPQDPPQKHISLIRVDEDGNRMELDTLIDEDEVFVWNGDTIGASDNFVWFGNRGVELDSLREAMEFDFDFEFDTDSLSEVTARIRRDVDQALSEIEVFRNGERMEIVIPDLPAPPAAPNPPQFFRFQRENSDNIIDLTDPNIISYERKERSGGREKITIIREIPSDD